MRQWSIAAVAALAAVLAACGGGGGALPAESAQAPDAPADTAPAEPADPTASWPVKPLLGIWSGTMSPGCGDLANAGVQTLFISSSDGVSFTVRATPEIGFPANMIGNDAASLGDENTLQWSGEPAFSLSKVDLRWSYSWQFKRVAPGQAQVTSSFRSLYNGVAGFHDCSGTLNRIG
jgi:hypothetical protein